MFPGEMCYQRRSCFKMANHFHLSCSTPTANLLLRRKINSSSTTVEDKEILKKYLTQPPVKRIDLEFPLGMTVTVRSMKGVTIKDALDAMHKPYKKRVSCSSHSSKQFMVCMHWSTNANCSSQADDELDKAYLEGFEWNGLRDGNTEEEKAHEWTRLHVRLQSTPGVTSGGGKKNKKKKDEEA